MSGGPARAATRVLVGLVGGALGCGLVLAAAVAAAAPVARAAPAAAPVPSLGPVVVASVGSGYTVTSEGPPNRSEFAALWPDPAAAGGVLATLTGAVSTYERVWADDGGANRVLDLLVRFPSVAPAQVFLRAARHALDSGEIVSAGPLAPVPGARRAVYFAPTGRAGVGQAITMRAGTEVDLLSFLSSASGTAQPVSPAAALEVAASQHAAMVAAPGGTVAPPGGATKRGASFAALGWAALAVAVLAGAVATPVVLRRHRARAPGWGPELGPGTQIR